MFVKTGILLCLLLLFYEDMRFRAVSWLIFPVLSLLFAADNYYSGSLARLMSDMGFNFGFLISQILLLTLYFSVKKRALINITKGYLGWGDVLFITTVGLYLSPLNFIFFYIATLLITLLISLAIASKYRVKEIKIPLAGIQAIILAFFILVTASVPGISLQSDNWLLGYLTK